MLEFKSDEFEKLTVRYESILTEMDECERLGLSEAWWQLRKLEKRLSAEIELLFDEIEIRDWRILSQ